MATCLVEGTILNLDGTPAVEGQVRASVRSTADDQAGQIVEGSAITSDAVVTFTDGTGRFVLALVQGAVVLLEIPMVNLRRLITVPTLEGPIDFTALL